jgi:hypothetical protein
MKVLELFAGSRSIGKEVDKNDSWECFSSDINDFKGIDYQIDINNFDVKKVPFIPDVIWCSPPCTYFSVASIGKHWNKDHTPKSINALKGVEFVKSTLKIINYFLNLNPNLVYYMENPRGKLRKLDVVKDLDRTTVWYCQYNDNLNGIKRAKPTDIWSNNIYSTFNNNGWKPRPQCFNGNPNCDHQRAPRGSQSGTQGLKGNYERSKLPNELVKEILETSEKKMKL